MNVMSRVNPNNFALAVNFTMTPKSYKVLKQNKVLHDLLQVVACKRLQMVKKGA